MIANPPVTLLKIFFEMFSMHCLVIDWSRGTIVTSSIHHVTNIFETLEIIQMAMYDRQLCFALFRSYLLYFPSFELLVWALFITLWKAFSKCRYYTLINRIGGVVEINTYTINTLIHFQLSSQAIFS